MRLLNRYILMDFITYFMACFLSILSIAVTFFILAELGTLNRDDGLLLFIDNILQSVPLIIEIIIPISVLLGTVITFVLLSKSSEITAMISAGVSHVQLLKPVLLFAVVICGFTYVNQSYLAPWWGSDTKMNIVSGKSEESIWRFYRGQIFYFKNPKKYIKKVDQGRIYRFNPDNGIAETEIMSHLKQTGSQWNIQSGVKISQDNGKIRQETVPDYAYGIDQFPLVFFKELTYPKYSSFSSIWESIQIKKKSGISSRSDLFAMYQKISSMIGIFVMVLLALPFSLFSSRQGNVKSGIVISVLLGLVFWLLDQTFVSLSSVGLILEEVAAFGANIIFTCLAVFFIYRRRI